MRIPSRAMARCLAALLIAVLALSLAGCSRLKIRRYMHEANSLYKAQEYEKAIEDYKKVVAIDPRYADAWLNMGYAYRALYHPGSEHPKDAAYADEGIKTFRKYLEINPDSEVARQFFLEFCTSAAKYDDAITFFREELTKKPDNAQLIKSIASLNEKKQEPEEAMKWYEKWSQLSSQDPEAWYTIGVTCWKRVYKNTSLSNVDRRALIDKGIQALGKALEIKPDYFEALSYMNLIYREKADVEMAEGNTVVAGQDLTAADTYRQKALDIRNAQLKAQAQGG